MNQTHAHLIGISGAGLRSLADYLLDSGWTISGSDQAISSTLRSHFMARGVSLFDGHHCDNIPLETTVCIHSLAIPELNPEREAASLREIPQFSYVSFLGKLFNEHTGVAIAGTHGKTTTSLILGHLLREADRSVGLIAGGKTIGSDKWGYAGQESILIAEACEFRQSLLELSPQYAAVLGIETDHFDCYPDLNSVTEVFRKFCDQVSSEGCLILNADCPATRIAAEAAKCSRQWFTLKEELDIELLETDTLWTISNIIQHKVGVDFFVTSHTGISAMLQAPVYGIHQIQNATAALLLALQLKVDWSDITTGLMSFPGVERRFQQRNHSSGAIFIDDYAHHPSEIRATLNALRQKFGEKPRHVIFQPHQVQRTEALFEEFVAALLPAEKVTLLPVFAARETADDRVESVPRRLVEAGNRQGGQFEYCPSLDHLCSSLDDSWKTVPNGREEVIATLGAGNIDRIYDELPGFIC
ncbi:UDP-N-acetylmuramate--L-alanine ligase [Rubinisphaera sp.]|uniref:UDP-N-acetylmuramate--L-alanine ligase n=1 Tax=Rubinisphaera sp. TaxID=2024857 RepID=UPI000C105286|nr:UDP-N-acetylmuramate--L-alanine ligase [Rubinisphaera sp.]MBV08642.1 UDP-N-acetylmuramate--L-alanine ligase [Rubinisphaera sp.]